MPQRYEVRVRKTRGGYQERQTGSGFWKEIIGRSLQGLQQFPQGRKGGSFRENRARIPDFAPQVPQMSNFRSRNSSTPQLRASSPEPRRQQFPTHGVGGIQPALAR